MDLLHDAKIRTPMTSQVFGIAYTYRESNARYVLQTDSDTIDVISVNDTLTNSTLQTPTSAWNTTGLLVNGVPQGDGAQLGTVVGSQVTWTYALGSPGVMKTLELIDGGSYDFGAGRTPIRGTPITFYRIPRNFTVVTVAPTPPANRLTIYGDSMLEGQVLGPTVLANQSSTYRGPIMIMRANAGASSSGLFAGAHVTNAASAARRLNEMASTPQLVTDYAAKMNQQLDGTGNNGIIEMIGYNDWASGLPASGFETQLANQADALHALRPSVKWWQVTPLTAKNEAIPNAAGSTLADFRTAVHNVASTRPWMVVIDGPTLVTWPTNFNADQVHPNTDGMVQWEANVRPFIGY